MKKLFNYRPIVFAAVSLAGGILAFYLYAKYLILPAILVVITPVVTGVVCSLCFKKEAFRFMLTAFGCFLLAAISFFNIALRFDSFFADASGYTDVAARVASVSASGDAVTYTLDSAEFFIGREKFEGETLYLYSAGLDIETGDEIIFTALLTPCKKTEGNELNINDFTRGKRFNISSDIEDMRVTGQRFGVAERIRNFVVGKMKRGMGDTNAAIAAAMLFGVKDELPRTLISEMRFAGIAHIFAVSGMHVGFVAGIVAFILRLCKTKRVPKLIISVIVVFLYVALCDFSASSVRAFLMFALFMTFRTFGWKHDILNSVATSAIILLLIRPQFGFSYGFLLSYSAVAGIALMDKPIKALFDFLPARVSDGLAVMLSAQLGLFPLSTLFFGYFSPVSLVLNFLLVPLISILFTLVALSALLSVILPFAEVIFFLPGAILGLVADFFYSVNFAALTVTGYFTGGMVAVYYFGLLAASDVINLKFAVKAVIFTLSICIFLLMSQLFAAGIL